MAITREHVLQALSTVPVDAKGTGLVASGRLSDVVVDDAGRVMFSITIDPSEAADMERVRQAAVTAVQGLPSVKGVFASLTADRPDRIRGSASLACGSAAAPGRGPAEEPAHPRRRACDRRRLRQRRRRQVDHRRQPGPRPQGARAEGRPSRCRHLRSVDAEASRHPWQAAPAREPHPGTHGGLRPQGHVHRLPGRGRGRHDLARPHGDVGDHPDAARGRLGRSRRAGGRHAAGHRRRPAHHGAGHAARRRGHRLDAAGSRADRCPARGLHVQAGRDPDPRHRREHGHLRLPPLRPDPPTSSGTAAPGKKPSAWTCPSSARCPST